MLIDSPTLTIPGPTMTGIGVQPSGDHDVATRRTPVHFTQGIQCLASGVTVVTSGDTHGQRFGLTSTEVCALSVEPPTLVVCIQRDDPLGRQLPRTQRFCVNLLSHRQGDVADAFDGTGNPREDRFAHGRWDVGMTGSPVLADALASFECDVDLLYAYPKHLIVVGRVRSTTHCADAESPLVRISGQVAEDRPAGRIPVGTH